LATALASLSSQLQIEIANSALEAEFKVIAEAIMRPCECITFYKKLASLAMAVTNNHRLQ
jgi:hypothetical protein